MAQVLLTTSLQLIANLRTSLNVNITTYQTTNVNWNLIVNTTSLGDAPRNCQNRSHHSSIVYNKKKWIKICNLLIKLLVKSSFVNINEWLRMLHDIVHKYRFRCNVKVVRNGPTILIVLEQFSREPDERFRRFTWKRWIRRCNNRCGRTLAAGSQVYIINMFALFQENVSNESVSTSYRYVTSSHCNKTFLWNTLFLYL